MDLRMEIVEAPDEADRAAIVAPLVAFNTAHGFPGNVETVAILLRDEAGAALGGLWGKTGFGWLFVELLIVPETARGGGIGARVLAAAEEVAKARGCVGAWLTTFAFQARGFYEKLGYHAFAELEDAPVGNTRIFMRKRFEAA